MADELPKPASRKEDFLAKAAGMSEVELPDPASREEIYLNAIAEGGGGGGSYTAGDGIDITDNTISVDTDTIQPKLTAGTGIDITDNTISATGGSGPTVVQTTGTSTTDVMSQNAVTSMIYDDPATKGKIKISDTLMTGSQLGAASISMGSDAKATKPNAIAIGRGAYAGHNNSVAIGYGATTSANGEFNIGAGYFTVGYNSSNYRLLSGVYDGQNAHDVATVGQINATIDAINTALSTNIPHIGA